MVGPRESVVQWRATAVFFFFFAAQCSTDEGKYKKLAVTGGL